ncbi:MAG: CopG family transcriptional regulator [Opitutus sp.]|nr:CopG family transcriptional regulator [Opitutus sp.]
MAAAKKKTSAPLTFDLPESLIAKIARTRKRRGLGSASEVVRLALAGFDFAKFNPARDPHSQISVRIAGDLRAQLRRTVRLKDSSMGELIRAALEQLSEKPSTSRKPR